MSDEIKKIIDNAWRNDEKLPDKDKNTFSWGWIIFLIFLLVAFILPILMIYFDFGPTETADTYEDVQEQGHQLEYDLWR